MVKGKEGTAKNNRPVISSRREPPPVSQERGKKKGGKIFSGTSVLLLPLKEPIVS